MKTVRTVLLVAVVVIGHIRVSVAADHPQQAFSVRLIHKEATTGTVVMTEDQKDTSGTITRTERHNVATNAIVSAAHVVGAKLCEVPGVPGSAVEVDLSDAGKKLLTSATSSAVGARLAVIVDGRVVSSPRVVGPIKNGKLFIFPFAGKEEAQQAIGKILKGRPN